MKQRLLHPEPVVFVVVALLVAAGLVVYLQDRALRALDRQTTALVQKVAEQTVESVVHQIRTTFDGPVFDTIASVSQPSPADESYRITALQFAKGLEQYPQVEKFVVWTGNDSTLSAEDIRFYDDRTRNLRQIEAASDPESLFSTHATLARHVATVVRDLGRTRKVYSTVIVRVDGVPYQIFMRLLYSDPARLHYFAAPGFIINLDKVRTTLFPALYRQRLAELLQPRDGSVEFDMRVEDDAGAHIFSSGPAAKGATSASAMVAIQFYPLVDIRNRMAGGLPAPAWTVTVSPHGDQAAVYLASTRQQSAWLSSASVLLMLVALAFAVLGSRRAAQLAKMQTDFVAHVSHQLKTPVSLLSAASETLALGRVKSPEKVSQFLDIVRAEARQLSSLVERILEFSRAGSARRYELEPVHLITLVHETAETFARAVAPVGYDIRVMPTEARPVVLADPMALEQAVVNLLDNAVKYSGGSRSIEVVVREQGGEATIDVVDHGVGVEPAERERIFERFYRGSGAAVHRQGFGLGLALVRELVKGQNGSVELAESAPGHGSAFRIHVPLVSRAWLPVTGLRGAWARLVQRRAQRSAKAREAL